MKATRSDGFLYNLQVRWIGASLLCRYRALVSVHYHEIEDILIAAFVF